MITVTKSLIWTLDSEPEELGRFSLPDDDEVYWGEGRIIE